MDPQRGRFRRRPVAVARIIPSPSNGVRSRGRLGSYQIVSVLGARGMGEVYRARDTRLERDVAIKVLPAQLAGGALTPRRAVA